MNTEALDTLAKVLHVDWAFKGKPKPDKVIIQNITNNGYHLSYKEFTERLQQYMDSECLKARRDEAELAYSYWHSKGGLSTGRYLLDRMSELNTGGIK